MSESLAKIIEMKQTITDECNGDLVLIIKGGGVGFNVDGLVIVKPVREWHRLAMLEYFPSLLHPAVKVDAQDVTLDYMQQK
jgi:hypothetical protein